MPAANSFRQRERNGEPPKPAKDETFQGACSHGGGGGLTGVFGLAEAAWRLPRLSLVHAFRLRWAGRECEPGPATARPCRKAAPSEPGRSQRPVSRGHRRVPGSLRGGGGTNVCSPTRAGILFTAQCGALTCREMPTGGRG